MYREKIIRMLKSTAIVDIWRWSKTSRISIFAICICKLISAGCSLVITVATKGLIDSATNHISGQMKFYVILLILAVVVIQGTALLSGLLSTKTNAVLLKDMRSMVYKKLLKKRYDSMDKYHSGELVNRMFSDVSIVKNGIMEIVPSLVSMSVSFIGAAIILLSMDWRFVTVLILGGCLGLILIIVFRQPIKTRHTAVQESESKLHAVLQETLENLRLIKASGSEMRMESQIDEKQGVFLSAQLRKGYFSTYMNSSINVVFHLSWLFCMLWGCRGIYQGSLTYGMLAAIIQLVGQIQGPIASVAGIASQAYQTISSAERIKEIIDLPEEETIVAADGRELYRELTEIRILDMDFSYGRGMESVLEQVNCRIEPGDFIALTGTSGSGKSTLFQLLLGIYSPCKGEILFCFRGDKAETASKRTRALFAYVPQGNTLFSGTLRENFTMFTEFATDEEILEAARIACIDDLISELADGLETVIGERGIGLSEGQAQRVAVARALLSRAPILLLDESTSALDEATEARLLQNISALKDKTCLIVTHRKAALGICDYKIHIEDGKVLFDRVRENICDR